MIVDIDNIPYSEITPNSLLVIRLPNGFNFTGGDRDMMDKLTAALREKVDPNVSVLIMQYGTDVFCVPEEVMNQGGWYKHAKHDQA